MTMTTNGADMDYQRFFTTFFQAKGALPILIVSILFSFGIGSTIGVIPDTIADRFARIHHGYSGEHCSSFDRIDKPAACQAGSDDGQASVAWANVALSILSLVGNPVVGSISDVWGRRILILASLGISCVPALVFCLLLWCPRLDPFWYYAANSLSGGINYLSLVFAALSDTMPPEYRAPSYGLLLAGFYGGYALAPSVPLVLSYMQVALFSLTLIVLALITAVLWLPETLALQIRRANLAARPHEDGNTTTSLASSTWQALSRPVREVAILNRDWTIRLVAAGSFFASMVFMSDATLVVYYIEDELNVRQDDIASMFFVLGVFGIVLQGACLQPLIQCLGEKGLLIASFLCGTVHNTLYGMARGKTTIYVALILSQVTKLNFGILSSLASKDASVKEQGRIQGALSASNSIAYAAGPLSMEFVHHYTKNKRHFGPGFMFIYAACLYAVGTILVSLIPIKVSGSEQQQQQHDDEGEVAALQTTHPEQEGLDHEGGDLEEPLLTASDKDSS